MKTRKKGSAGKSADGRPGPDVRHLLGRRGEEESARYLSEKGYEILERDFRLFRGDIDLIACHEGTLVFVEVKTRTSDDFGFPEGALSPRKQKQIRKIALGYLLKNGLREDQTASLRRSVPDLERRPAIRNQARFGRVLAPHSKGIGEAE